MGAFSRGVHYKISLCRMYEAVLIGFLFMGCITLALIYCTNIAYIFCAGIPEFVAEPPSEVEVNEHSSLELTIELEGNPKPKAYFRWSHRSSLSVVTASSGRSNPFRYHAKYKLYNVDASFCGERLQTTLRNSLGSSTTKHVRVVVLCKLASLIC